MKVWRSGDTTGLGTVVRTFQSAPRPAGASMVVGPDGSVAGSVSGGCVEGAVYESASLALSTGEPMFERYGVSDDDAFAVGLTCGGTLEVLVEPVSRATFPDLDAVADAIASDRPVAVGTVVRHTDPSWVGRHVVVGEEEAHGSLCESGFDETRLLHVRQPGRARLDSGKVCRR